ncbi:MAG TPA: hypothetical protein QGF95_27615 [Candidatus Latescibacteria bacterium]|nr:hypothetical protein [Candidatus Latescibacterota bacterium]
MSVFQQRTTLTVLCAAVLATAAVRVDAAASSDPVRSVDNIPPAPATEIRALNTGEEILVTWTASADDAMSFSVFGDAYIPIGGLNGYHIYRAVQGADAELIGTTAPGVVEFADPVAITGTTYIYSVSPFDADNETLPDIEPGSAEDLARIVSLGGGPPDVIVTTTVKAQMSFDVVVDVTDSAAVESFTADFITLVASLLGIDASRIIVTSVTEGSTIVDFKIADIEGEDDVPAAADALAQLVTIVADDTEDEFASIGPVLDLVDESSDDVIVIPFPVDTDGLIVLSWFSRLGDAVGFDDFFLFADNFGLGEGQEGYDATYDVVPNGQVDFDDFFRFADDFGTPIANAAEIQALLGQ